MQAQWITSWSRAQRGLGLVSHLFQPHQCVSLTMPQTKQVRFRFGAFYEEIALTITNVVCKWENGSSSITFSNQLNPTLQPQEGIVSDAIVFHEPMSEITLEYDIISEHIPYSGVQLMPYDEVQAEHNVIYLFCGLDIQSDQFHGGIVAFGDSITEQGRWSTPLRTWAKEHGYLLVNHGISGNRLLKDLQHVSIDPAHASMLEGTNLQHNRKGIGTHYDIPLGKQCFGKSGLARFAQEIDVCCGIQLVIFALGVNDLYQPGTFCATMEELPTLDAFQQGWYQLFTQAQKRGLQVVNLGLTPFGGSGSDTKEKETLRLAINTFLKEVSGTLGYVDFDEILSDRPGWMKEEYHQGDHLHPSDKGGSLMAQAIIQELSNYD